MNDPAHRDAGTGWGWGTTGRPRAVLHERPHVAAVYRWARDQGFGGLAASVLGARLRAVDECRVFLGASVKTLSPPDSVPGLVELASLIDQNLSGGQTFWLLPGKAVEDVCATAVLVLALRDLGLPPEQLRVAGLPLGDGPRVREEAVLACDGLKLRLDHGAGSLPLAVAKDESGAAPQAASDNGNGRLALNTWLLACQLRRLALARGEHRKLRLVASLQLVLLGATATGLDLRDPDLRAVALAGQTQIRANSLPISLCLGAFLSPVSLTKLTRWAQFTPAGVGTRDLLECLLGEDRDLVPHRFAAITERANAARQRWLADVAKLSEVGTQQLGRGRCAVTLRASTEDAATSSALAEALQRRLGRVVLLIRDTDANAAWLEAEMAGSADFARLQAMVGDAIQEVTGASASLTRALRIERSRLPWVEEALDRLCRESARGQQAECPWLIDGWLELERTPPAEVAELGRLGPFGPGFEVPVWGFRGRVVSLDVSRRQPQALQLRLGQGALQIDATWPKAFASRGPLARSLRAGDVVDVVCSLRAAVDQRSLRFDLLVRDLAVVRGDSRNSAW